MPARNATYATTLVEALRRCGVEQACVTPGSRSTPLALALADSPITDWSHHDERSSAFFALGIARSSGRPVIVVTTSGTAAAELHPAVVEARYGRVPLIIITADRPFELREVGAPQTIDQQDLFGRSVKWSHDIEVPDPAISGPEAVAPLAARLVAEAAAIPAGPVHLNLRFREPLLPPGPVTPPEIMVPRVIGGIPRVAPEAIAEVVALVAGRRGLVIAGPQDDGAAAIAAAALAGAAGWPILADPLSGLRRGGHDRARVLTASDALGWAGMIEESAPDVVIRFGAIPTSKPISQWLERHRHVPQILIDPAGWRDPTASAGLVLRADPAATLTALAEGIGQATAPEWMDRWHQADTAAASALHRLLDDAPFPNEPVIARSVADAMPAGATLWVASSMPVRDLDAVLRPDPRPLGVRANRGANGIDGFISTALGAAAVTPTPVVALAGDLSILHDIGALASAARLRIPATIVAVNNDGGGIFHLLPQDGHPHFERHWGTPHGLALGRVAEAMGLAAEVVTTRERLEDLVAHPTDHPRFVELETDRVANAELHREMRRVVAAAL